MGPRGLSRVSLEPRFEINDATSALAAAEVGHGITIALSYMVAASIREGRRAPVLLPLCLPAVPVQLVYPESRIVAPRSRAFIDYAGPRIKTALAEPQGQGVASNVFVTRHKGDVLTGRRLLHASRLELRQHRPRHGVLHQRHHERDRAQVQPGDEVGPCKPNGEECCFPCAIMSGYRPRPMRLRRVSCGRKFCRHSRWPASS